jgi:hypothetical protein
MAWPSPQDYSEAVQSPRTAFQERELQQGSPELNHLGLPRPRSGSFATVYKILSGTRNWAVRCFLYPVSDQQERYEEISRHLATIRLPYLVQFSFLPQGMRVGKQTYPILKMEWVEGEPLASYIERNLGSGSVLLGLAGRWFEMMKALRQSSIAHGDLQHGNVLVLNGELKLVDYDGMFVPGLRGKSSNELGQRNYQHPQRTEFDFDANLDNFSSWVIYISLIALGLQPQLWRQFRGGDECLLFRKEDYESPERSAIFGALEKAQDDKLRSAIAFFRSLLDLGTQDVPSLDGQVLPPVALPPKVSSGGSWIADHLKQPTTTNSPSGPTTLDVAPTPSWIQDFIAPTISENKLRGFENPISQERVALGISACMLMLIGISVTFKIIGLMTLVWAPSLIFLCNYLFWTRRFRLEPAVAALENVDLELRAIAERIDLAREAIKSRQTDKKSIHERYSFEQNKATKDLEAARRDEKSELEGTQASLQLEKNSIDARRRALNQQEKNDLHNISNGLGSQLATLNSKISGLGHAESAELGRMLSAQQSQYLISYLRTYCLDDASIPGLGPSFKSRLRMAGIRSAADVDHRIYSVKGIGAARSSALNAWQQSLKTRAHQIMPKILSTAETGCIRSKYASQMQTLQSEKVLVEQRVREADAHVRTKYKGLREPLEAEELTATYRMRSKVEIVEKKYKDRYASLGKICRQLDDDFKRGVTELEERNNKERRNLFALHWEQEKIRRQLRAFSRVSFAAYVKRVLGLL